MSRRRLDRQQERDNFLQQFDELITFNTRIEVVEAEGPPIPLPPLPPAPPPGPQQVQVEEVGAEYYGPLFPNVDVVISQDGGPQQSLGLGPALPGPGIFLTPFVEGEDFGILAASDDPVPFFFGPPIGPQPIDGPGTGGPDFTLLSITENGFGVVSGDEFGEEEVGPPLPPMLNGEDMRPLPEFPEGLDTIGQGEQFGFDTQGLINIIGPGVRSETQEVGSFGEDYGEDSDEDGAISFGIDFTASGRGSVEITLFGEDGEEYTETFDIPFGQSADDLLSFEVDAPDGETFEGAVVGVTGSVEISIVGIDITSNIDQFGPLLT